MYDIKVIQIMPEFGLAGAEIMVENLVKELKSKVREVIVLSLYDYHSPITERIEKEGIRIIYLGKRKGLDLSIIRKIYKVLKQERPDVIHTHRHVMHYVIPAAVLAGIKKRVHTIHNLANKELSFFQRILASFFYKFNKVRPVALSSITQKSIVKTYKLKPEKVETVFNGINLSKCLIKSDYNLNGILKILHIGRFSKPKNHQVIIECAKLLKGKGIDFEIKLIGQGELLEDVKTKVQQEDITDYIKFLGIKPSVFEELNQADIFILPSLWEGMPMTLIEAMGTGLPIIASKVGGIPDMIDDGENGILINPVAEELANSIILLYENKELREKLGKKALSKSINFSATTMCDNYLKIYKNTIY